MESTAKAKSTKSIKPPKILNQWEKFDQAIARRRLIKKLCNKPTPLLQSELHKLRRMIDIQPNMADLIRLRLSEEPNIVAQYRTKLESSVYEKTRKIKRESSRRIKKRKHDEFNANLEEQVKYMQSMQEAARKQQMDEEARLKKQQEEEEIGRFFV